jgi:hypothetical protein
LYIAPSLSRMVTDGANRIGERGVPAPLSPVGFLVAVVFAAVACRMGRNRAVAWIAIPGALALAVPGLETIAGQRSDSPARATEAAATIERFRDEVERFSEEHGCAAVSVSECVACEPVVDFALATAPPCDTPASIRLGQDSLRDGCAETGASLTCGRFRSR